VPLQFGSFRAERDRRCRATRMRLSTWSQRGTNFEIATGQFEADRSPALGDTICSSGLRKVMRRAGQGVTSDHGPTGEWLELPLLAQVFVEFGTP